MKLFFWSSWLRGRSATATRQTREGMGPSGGSTSSARKLKLIIYDLDGTLVDTREDIALSANYMLTQMQAPQLPHDEIARYVGRGVFHLIKNCLKTDDQRQIDKGIKIYRKYYGEHMLDHSKLYPGAKQTLQAFDSRKQVVLTNKPNPFSRELLEALGVAKYFSEIIAGDSNFPKKPDPAAIFAMQQRFDASSSETLFVGDSAVDIETARNAGVPIVVVTHGFSNETELKAARPDGIVKNFHQLTEWMSKKG